MTPLDLLGLLLVCLTILVTVGGAMRHLASARIAEAQSRAEIAQSQERTVKSHVEGQLEALREEAIREAARRAEQ